MRVELEAKDVKKLLFKVYKRYHSGNISDSTAYKETYLLNSILKAIELVDLEDRLKRIEDTLRND